MIDVVESKVRAYVLLLFAVKLEDSLQLLFDEVRVLDFRMLWRGSELVTHIHVDFIDFLFFSF
jgi:hypothetical protein